MTGQVMAGETSGDKEEMMDQDRSPIWTIPRGEITAFFAFFTTLMIAGFSFVGFHEYYANQSQGIFSIIRKVIANAGSVTAGSAGIAIVASETTRWMMVIASYFRDKFLEPQRERYRNQGREQGTPGGVGERAPGDGKPVAGVEPAEPRRPGEGGRVQRATTGRGVTRSMTLRLLPKVRLTGPKL